MARDRLAAMRGNDDTQAGYNYGQTAAPSQGNYGNSPAYGRQDQDYSRQEYGNQAYGRNAPQAGYGGSAAAQYGGGDQYELQQRNPPGASGDMNQFFNEINSIQDGTKQLNDQVNHIKRLQSQLASGVDEQQNQQATAELERATNDARGLSNQLKKHIKSLEASNARVPPSSPDLSMRKNQVKVAKSRFVQAVQYYQQVEQESRKKYKQRIERQYRIVKPAASDEEVREVVESDQNGQIFSQALLNSSRYGEARAAQREVQQRHEDIRKIENTMTELARLMEDMAVVVDQQDDKIVQIEETTGGVETDVRQAEGKLRQAKISAKKARRKRWIFFFIILIIIIVIAVVVAVEVVKSQNNK